MKETPSAQIGAHCKCGKKYQIIPVIQHISGTRDAVFTVAASALLRSGLVFKEGPHNSQFVFRCSPDDDDTTVIDEIEIEEPEPEPEIEEPEPEPEPELAPELAPKPKPEPIQLIQPDPYYCYVDPWTYKLDHTYISSDLDICFYVPPRVKTPKVYAEPAFYITKPVELRTLAPPPREFTLDIMRNITSGEDLVTVQTMAEDVIECRRRVEEIDNKSLAELIAYKNPPDAVYKTIRAVLAILGHSAMRHWEKEIRRVLKDNFLKKVKSYDPTTEQEEKKFIHARSEVKGLDYETCMKKGSLPTALLFSFVQVALRVRTMAEVLRRKSRQQLEQKKRVNVTVVKGANLAIRDTIPQSSGTLFVETKITFIDPYVKVKFGRMLEKTATIYHNLNPIWNEIFHFE
jgi:hypothetical protein